MNQEKKPYFCICINCGSHEWLELKEDDFDKVGKPIWNWLRRDGTTMYPNAKLIKKMVYKDVICAKCEAPMVLFDKTEFTNSECAKILDMHTEEKIKMAEKYLVIDALEEKEPEPEKKQNVASTLGNLTGAFFTLAVGTQVLNQFTQQMNGTTKQKKNKYPKWPK